MLLSLGAPLCLLGAGCDDEDARTDAAVSGEDDDSGAGGRGADSGQDADAGLSKNSSCGEGFGRISLYEGGFRQFPGLVSGPAASIGGETSALVESVENSAVHLRAGDTKYRLEAPVPISFGVDPGETLELRWQHYEPSTYGGRKTQLSLRAGDRLAFSYTMGADLPQGFSFERGAEQCRGEGRCTRWVSEALIVRGPCGESVEVASGEHGTVCGYEVRPGEVRRTIEYVADRLTTCADFFQTGTELTLAATDDARDDDAGVQDVKR